MIKEFPTEILEVYSELQGYLYFFKEYYVAISDHLIGYTTIKSYFFDTKKEAEDFIAQKSLLATHVTNMYYMVREYKKQGNHKYVIEPCTLIYIKQGFLPGLISEEFNLMLQEKNIFHNIALFNDALEADIYVSLLMENNE